MKIEDSRTNSKSKSPYRCRTNSHCVFFIFLCYAWYKTAKSRHAHTTPLLWHILVLHKTANDKELAQDISKWTQANRLLIELTDALC